MCHFRGTYPPIYHCYRSYYLQIHYKPTYFLGSLSIACNKGRLFCWCRLMGKCRLTKMNNYVKMKKNCFLFIFVVEKHWPGVNFINILCAPFFANIFAQKLQSQNVTREKMRKALLYEKCMKTVDEIDLWTTLVLSIISEVARWVFLH